MPVTSENDEVVAVATEPVVEQEINTVKAVVKDLLAKGAKRLNGLKIKNVNITEKEQYIMVSFTLTSPIRGFISEDNGVTFTEGKTPTLFTSLYAICGILKENDSTAWMANTLLSKPNALTLLLNGAKIDIIQQDVPAGTEYHNPFSTSATEGVTYDHDIIINNIIGIELGQTGAKMADRLADKLLGF